MTRTAGAYDDTPAGRLLLAAIDFETGNEEQAARRLAGLVADAAGQPPRPPPARRRTMADGRRRAVAATLRPIADLPDADSYACP